MPLVRPNLFEHIKTGGIFKIPWVEIDHFINPFLWDKVQEAFSQVSRRIDEQFAD